MIMVPTPRSFRATPFLAKGRLDICSCYVLIRHDQPPRQLAHAKRKANGKDGCCSQQEGRPNHARPRANPRPATRILASPVRGRRRGRAIPILHCLAGAYRHSAASAESELPALRADCRDTEGRCRPPLWAARHLEGCGAAPPRRHLYTADGAT
jgi:hypothetical protein